MIHSMNVSVQGKAVSLHVLFHVQCLMSDEEKYKEFK